MTRKSPIHLPFIVLMLFCREEEDEETEGAEEMERESGDADIIMVALMYVSDIRETNDYTVECMRKTVGRDTYTKEDQNRARMEVARLTVHCFVNLR